MRILRFFISWQFWLSILLFAGISYGIYYFIFNKWLFEHTNHNKNIFVPDLDSLDVKTATYKLDSLGLTYDFDSIKYDSTKLPSRIISYYPKSGSTVKEGRTIFIKSNPSSWLPVELPELVDKSNRLAYTQLKIAGLEVGDTLYEPDIAKNVVLKVLYEGKQIKAGTKLPRFSKVDLVLGRGLLKDIPVPNLLDLSVDQAKTLIKQRFFEIGNVNYRGDIQDSAKIRVFFQDPKGDDILDQGLPINLWVTDSITDEIQEEIAKLTEQFKNIFEDEDTLKIQNYIKSRNNQSIRSLDLGTRRQLDDDVGSSTNNSSRRNNRSTKPRNTNTTSNQNTNNAPDSGEEEIIIPVEEE